MRYDTKGLWWEEEEAPTTRIDRHHSRIVAPPESKWRPPTELPNIVGAELIALDTETKDLELINRGPGAVRGAANLVGISIATGTPECAWYFPLAHEYEAQCHFNMDKEKVLRWLTDVLAQSRSIVGAHLLYDLEQLRAEGVRVPRHVRLLDVQYAEPLLNEEAKSYSLESLARKYLATGKETSVLYKWCADSFGGEPDEKQRANIWRAPPSLVGPYAEGDALLPLRILHAQQAALTKEGLSDLFELECGLIPLLLDMRFRGVPVDIDGARALIDQLRPQAARAQAQIPGVDVWANASIAAAMDEAGVEYTRTEAGNPSFTKEWLESCEHPIAKAVLEVRLCEKAINPFIESYILGGHHNGRIHCQFHPLRSDSYGTVSGRFSSSNPNLQNIPSRHKVLAPLLRGLFRPEQGEQWVCMDYSQIEYRLLVHYAGSSKAAQEMRRRYVTNPDTDFHQLTVDMVQEITGIGLARTPAKNINFGLVYGMGKEKLIRSLGVEADIGERLYEAYFAALPAVRETYLRAERRARNREGNYVRTLLGRRRRFIDAQGTHKALNSVLQGGAADIIKKAMLDIYNSGVVDVLGVPYLTVHDELDWSDPCTAQSAEALAEVERLMVDCVQLTVPLRVSVSRGATWGACK